MMIQDLLQLRKQKVENEIKTARMIQERGIHPLDVLDDLIKAVIDLQRIGILKQNPDASEAQILEKMKETVRLNHLIREKKEELIKIGRIP